MKLNDLKYRNTCEETLLKAMLRFTSGSAISLEEFKDELFDTPAFRLYMNKVTKQKDPEIAFSYMMTTFEVDALILEKSGKVKLNRKAIDKRLKEMEIYTGLLEAGKINLLHMIKKLIAERLASKKYDKSKLLWDVEIKLHVMAYSDLKGVNTVKEFSSIIRNLARENVIIEKDDILSLASEKAVMNKGSARDVTDKIFSKYLQKAGDNVRIIKIINSMKVLRNIDELVYDELIVPIELFVENLTGGRKFKSAPGLPAMGLTGGGAEDKELQTIYDIITQSDKPEKELKRYLKH